MVIEKSLAGPIGIFVKFSTLQDHGVDKVFFLENDNVDASQKNVIFLARGEKANQPIAITGMYLLLLSCLFRTWDAFPLLDQDMSTLPALHSLNLTNKGSSSRLRGFSPTLHSQS